jgi:hypothetical protein
MNRLPCLLCNKDLEPTVKDQSHIQPDDGIVCYSRGNYGSKIYDSIIDSDGMDCELVFNLCDDCLITASDHGKIAEYRNDKFAKSKDPYQYVVPLHARLWVESETHEEYNQKLKDAGLLDEEDDTEYIKALFQQYKEDQIAGKDNI